METSGLEQGLEIHCDADLPARSGLGSSSSFVVGILNSLQAFEGKRVSKEWLTQEAIWIEQEVLKETVGSQDQTAAAHGGFNVISFATDGGINVTPVIMPGERKVLLNNHLMLFFTGFSRIASSIAKSKVANLKRKSDELHRMRTMVDDAMDILTSEQDIRYFGEMLHSAWEHKRSLSDQVSNSQIDNLYLKARQAGAIGGKLLGAGGGGFMVLFVEPEKQASVKKALSRLIQVPFKFESTGSQVIYYQPSG
nr:hypothetical protein [Candidatus Thiosymbion oneisti]